MLPTEPGSLRQRFPELARQPRLEFGQNAGLGRLDAVDTGNNQVESLTGRSLMGTEPSPYGLSHTIGGERRGADLQNAGAAPGDAPVSGNTPVSGDARVSGDASTHQKP